MQLQIINNSPKQKEVIFMPKVTIPTKCGKCGSEKFRHEELGIAAGRPARTRAFYEDIREIDHLPSIDVTERKQKKESAKTGWLPYFFTDGADETRTRDLRRAQDWLSVLPIYFYLVYFAKNSS